MIVVGLIVAWCIVVTLLCAVMRRATRVPWWETVLLDLDRLEVSVTDEPMYTPRDQTV